MFLRTAYWAAALLLCLAAFPAQAADERFAVEINVDVTDSNASLARERAMSEAKPEPQSWRWQNGLRPAKGPQDLPR